MLHSVMVMALLSTSMVVAHQDVAQPAVREPLSPQRRFEGFQRHCSELTLQREPVMAALARLERPVATILADQIFRDYANVVGAAQVQAEADLFPLIGGERTATTLSSERLTQAVQALERAYVDATAMAITDLARAGGTDAATTALIRADLYRRLFARAQGPHFLLSPSDGRDGVDALTIWQNVVTREPLIAAIAAPAMSDPATTEALAVFRAKGESLGRAMFEELAETAAFYASVDAERIPVALRIDRAARGRATAAWRDANHDMATALESALSNAGHPVAAAVWRIAYFGVTERRTLAQMSMPARAIDFAITQGAPREEIDAMQAAMVTSLPQQASLMKRVVAEYQRWDQDARRRGEWLFVSPPPDALIRAYDALEQHEKSVRDRIAALLTSTIVREQVQSVQADVTAVPLWRQLQTGMATYAGVAWAAPQLPQETPP